MGGSNRTFGNMNLAVAVSAAPVAPENATQARPRELKSERRVMFSGWGPEGAAGWSDFGPAAAAAGPAPAGGAAPASFGRTVPAVTTESFGGPAGAAGFTAPAAAGLATAGAGFTAAGVAPGVAG